ncbi:MAG: lysophospholipid acyltransferase family protein [Bacteroidota bacterium]
MKPAFHWIQFALFQLLSAILGLLPLATVRGLAGWLGKLAYWLGVRREIVRENVEHAFPEMGESEREAIAVGSFRSVAVTFIELLRFSWMSEDDLSSMIRLERVEVLQEKLLNGKGAVILTAHLGNWELISPGYLVLAGIPVDALYKPQSNAWIDRRILERRTKFGNKLVPMGMSVRETLGILQSGRSVLIAADQSAPKESIRMKFFGREVPVFQGPAVFSLKTGAPLIAAYALRQSDGSYVLTCSEIPSNDLSYSEESVRELTRRHVEETELVIRQYPEQWMWMHRRWKHVTKDHETH